MTKAGRSLVFALLLLVFSASGLALAQQEISVLALAQQEIYRRVASVIDGDTIWRIGSGVRRYIANRATLITIVASLLSVSREQKT